MRFPGILQHSVIERQAGDVSRHAIQVLGATWVCCFRDGFDIASGYPVGRLCRFVFTGKLTLGEPERQIDGWL